MGIRLIKFHVLCELHPARQWTSPLIELSTYLLVLFIKGWKEMAYVGKERKTRKSWEINFLHFCFIYLLVYKVTVSDIFFYSKFLSGEKYPALSLFVDYTSGVVDPLKFLAASTCGLHSCS